MSDKDQFQAEALSSESHLDLETSSTSEDSENLAAFAQNNFQLQGNGIEVDNEGSKGSQTTVNEQTLDRLNSRQLSRPLRPLVEWVYPMSDTRNEDQNINSMNAETIPYVVDPSQTIITLEVEGVLVPPRRCFVKACGFVLCSEELPGYVNRKFFSILMTLLSGIFIGTYFIIKSYTINSSILNNNPVQMKSLYPSMSPTVSFSESPSYFAIDPRVTNITSVLQEISGDVISKESSPQNKALNWILYNDTMNLQYNSSNLMQRYILMTFFHNLSGEDWFRNDGFGTGQHECKWFGIGCSSKNNVKELKMENNNLRGSMPTEIGLLSSLEGLFFLRNKIQGTIPSEIGQLSKLSFLKVTSNSLSGAIPEEIGNCKQLQDLSLSTNRLNGGIPTTLGNLKILQKLVLSSNMLSGTIPSDIGKLKSLFALNLFDNGLTGKIPSQVEQMSFINTLDLGRNKLSGTISSTLMQFSAVNALRLDENLFSGTIPSNIFQLSTIVDLYLSNNLFTGTIPSFIKSSSKASEINLSNNEISGVIPDSFSNFTRLKKMDLTNTKLYGSMPTSICALSLLSLKADCKGDMPEISCSCCTECL